jgi:hypothetical protein
VKLAHPQWFTDRTHEYERLQVREQLGELGLQTDTAVDVLVAQRDILDLVMLFKAPARYGIVPPRSDEFVHVLDQHKRMGGSRDDFNPFSTNDGAGTRVQWAITMGYLHDRETGPDALRSQMREGESGAAAQQAPARAQIPVLSQAGERFYARPENEVFRRSVVGVIRMLSEDGGNDGRLMRTAFETRFGNDPARRERAVLAEIHNFLTSTRAPDVSLRAGYGLTISGQGESLTVTHDPLDRRVRENLRAHIKRFMLSMTTSPAAPAAPAGGNK